MGATFRITAAFLRKLSPPPFTMPPDHQYVSIPLISFFKSESDDVSNEVANVDQIPPKQDRNSLEKTYFLDGSDTLFSLYNEKAREFDLRLIQNWREDAKGLILLSGLVSASVAGFLSQAYFSSQDDSSFYLSQIYQLQVGQDIFVDDPLEAVAGPFTSFSQIVWFTSLMTSLVCAVGATLVQGLVRRYLLTQLEYSSSPHWCARIRACIMQEGFPEFVSRFLKYLNLLLHTSIYLFLCGLLFLAISSGNLVTASVVGLSFVLSLALYLVFAWRWNIHLRFLIFSPLSLIRRRDLDIQPPTGWPTLLHATAQEIVKHVSTRTVTLDDRAMSWLIKSLVHEQELEGFLTGIPGFYNSTRVENPAQVLRGANTDIIPKAIVALVNHSLSSNLVSDTARHRRVMVSLKAMQTDPYLLQRTFYHALCSTESAIFRSFTFVLFADQYANDEDPNICSLARCTIAIAIAINHPEDYHSNEPSAGVIQRRLNWSEALFSQYCGQPDSVKLRNLVHLALELYIAHSGLGSGSPSPEVFRNLLHVARQLNVETTAPELQHEFCDLWNWLLDAMQCWPEHPALRSKVMLILSSIHPIFVTLHQGTSQSSTPLASTGSLDLQDPSSCPRCLDLSHCPSAFANPNPNIHVAHGGGDA
ncbi:hypothetical protein EDB85DRAFT_268238 [Lactarius pseudohatsudake]|nr:hypothetical protein EDB85DRAFT_268238 [Lactarius pseudohatsudake]